MYNKATLVGRLGGDPDIRYSKEGTMAANFTMATSERYKGQEKTEWHKIVMWGKLAELCEKYLQKGSLVLIEGKIQSKWWKDPKTGKNIKTYEIIGSHLVMLATIPGKEVEEREPAPPQPRDIPF